MTNNIFATRMRQAMNEKNVTAAELVRMTGIGKSAISSYLSGRYLPKQNNTFYIARALEVSPAWLMGGSIKEPPTQLPVLTTADQALLDDFHKLNDTGRAIALGAVKSLTLNPEYIEKEKATSA